MLAHKYVMKMGSNVFASLVSFISLMVMTRYVGDEYGTMMWAWAFVAVFNAVTDMGFNLTNVKFVSEGRDLSRCLSTFLTIKLMTGGLMAVLTLISAFVSLSFSHTMDMNAFKVVLIFVLYYLVWDIQNAVTYTFDGKGKNGKSSIVFAVEYLFRGTALIILALAEVSADILCLGYIVGIVASSLMTLRLLRGSGVRLCRPEYLREYAAFTAPIAASLLMVTVVEYLDKVIIGFSFDGREVGYYTAAAGVIWTFTTLGKSLNTVILPQLPKYLAEDGGKKKVQSMIWKTERYLALLVFPVMVMMLLFGDDIASVLFGNGYSRSGDVLSVQCFMLYSTIVSALMTQILYATNNARPYGICAAAYVVTVFVGFVTLIPTYGAGMGAVGAGLAMSIGYVLQAILLSRVVSRKVGIGFYGRLWRHGLAAVADALVLLAIDSVIPLQGLVLLVAASLLCLVIHFGFCILLKEFDRSDLRYFMQALDPRRIKQSIDEEMTGR